MENMWFKKIIQEQNENIQKVLNILDNCNHLVKIDTLYKKIVILSIVILI